MKTFLQLLSLSMLTASLCFAGNVDTKKSVLKWKGTKVTGEHFGKISLKDGDVKLSKDGSLKGGSFTVNMDSITVEDLSGEWATKFLTHIKSKDFFTVEKHPEAKLVIDSVKGDTAKGKLTIKGKTNPVEFKYKKDGKGFSGKLTFDRTKFDMKYGSGSFFKGLGDKMIHDTVHLDFKVVTK